MNTREFAVAQEQIIAIGRMIGTLPPLEEFLALDRNIEGAGMVLESSDPAGIALARALARRMQPIQNIVAGRDVLSVDTSRPRSRRAAGRPGPAPTRSSCGTL